MVCTARQTERTHAMSLRINDTAPDFTAPSTEGPIRFHDWAGDSLSLIHI